MGLFGLRLGCGRQWPCKRLRRLACAEACCSSGQRQSPEDCSFLIRENGVVIPICLQVVIVSDTFPAEIIAAGQKVQLPATVAVWV